MVHLILLFAILIYDVSSINLHLSSEHRPSRVHRRLVSQPPPYGGEIVDESYILKNANRPIAAGNNVTWNDVQIAIEAGGHKFCPLIWQSWACIGESYSSFLKSIAPFNDELYGMHLVRNGTFIYAEGGSQLAHLLLYWVCSSNTIKSNDTTVYKLPNSLGEHYTALSDEGADIYIVIESTKTRFLFLLGSPTHNSAINSNSNDIVQQGEEEQVPKDPCGLLSRARYLRAKAPVTIDSITMNVIVLGEFDEDRCIPDEQRHQQGQGPRLQNVDEREIRRAFYAARYPSTQLVLSKHVGSSLTSTTTHSSFNSRTSSSGSTSSNGDGVGQNGQNLCLPGLLVREAELLAAEIIDASHRAAASNHGSASTHNHPDSGKEESLGSSPLDFSTKPLKPADIDIGQALDTYFGQNVADILHSIEPTKKTAPFLVQHRSDPFHAVNGIRTEHHEDFTWDDVAASARAGGHHYCTLLKDNWSCAGERYIKVLMETKPFDATRFAIDRVLPNNSVSVYRLRSLRLISCLAPHLC